MKTLIAFKNPAIDSPTACHQGLGITALNTAMSLRELRIEADAAPIANGENLWGRLAGPWKDYTHIVLEAPFIDSAFLERMFQQFPGKRFTIIYHSNLGFLSHDAFAGKSIPLYVALEKACPNFRLAANSLELSSAIQAATGFPFNYLPNLYHLPSQVRRTRARWQKGQVLHLGLFGAARALKNWLTAGVAAMIISRTLDAPVRFHVSHGRDEGGAATRQNLASLLAMNPQVGLVEVPWLGHDDFRRYLYGMDLLLQPSFSETFNNVTADGCFCGVPSVVSEAIDWAPNNWIAKADSAVSVAKTGCALLRDRNAPAQGWKALDNYNQAAVKAWKDWLQA
jgi:hypothetical protein